MTPDSGSKTTAISTIRGKAPFFCFFRPRFLRPRAPCEKSRLATGRDLAFAPLCASQRKIPLSLLTLGSAPILYMPGELFVEYQLAAQQMAPGSFVAMAAYGDYGPGYIGTRIAYSQGGYETGPVSRTSPDVENVLMS